MSRTYFSPDRKEKIFPWLPAPVHETRRGRAVDVAWFHLGCIVIEERRRRSVSETGKPGRLPSWQYIDLSEARGLVLSWVVREGIGITRRLSARWDFTPTGHWDTHSRTRASQEPIHHAPNQSPRRWKRLLPETLKRLASSVCRCRSVFSLLPQCQRNGCNLACQRKAHHGRLDAFGDERW